MPTRMKNRWVYAAYSWLIAVTYMSLPFMLSFILGDVEQSSWVDMILNPPIDFIGIAAMALTVPVAALFCWPKSKYRSKDKMFWTGVTTVVVSIIMTSFYLGFPAVSLSSDQVLWQNLVATLIMSPIIFVFIVVATFGTPFIVGGFASRPFVNEIIETKGP